MKLTLTPQLLEPRNPFNHIEYSSRKKELSPAKQVGQFRTEEGEAPSGGSHLAARTSLTCKIRYLFNQVPSISPNESHEAAWGVGEYLNSNPELAILGLVREISALKMMGDIYSARRITIALIGTIEKDKLKAALMSILHKDTAYCNDEVIKFAFKQLGQKVVPDLIKDLKIDNPELRHQVMKILGSLGEHAIEAVQELTERARNDRSSTGRLAANTIKEIMNDLTKTTSEAAF